MGPGEQPSAGVGLTAILPRSGAVKLAPAVQARELRVPSEAGVVAIAYSDHPAGPADAHHLPQRTNRIRKMLQDLVRVHDVVRVILDLQTLHIANQQVDVAASASFELGSSEVESVLGQLDRGHPPWRNEVRQVSGDRSRPASDIEQALPTSQVWQQIGSGARGGTGAV